ncbi:expressed unknown protein [Seminavis robusta]|uniref:Uncharacterized protein n=1 Tax=Seminavis robusta TaxID=568900 RepID=A0A9N8F395_9STRA|nr:expressed unknown protein [Seminavis robusta]|eukprot:Sro3033_g342520.1 n/a (264) ;mRNA; r:3194-4144
MPSSSSTGLQLAVTISQLWMGIQAFSSSTPQQRPFVELTNPLIDIPDRLPASFVANWPTFVLDGRSWTRIPDSHGFVPPHSLEELWQPQDLQLPTCRLAVGIHVRNGVIRHILPAIDLTLAEEHRNRGLNKLESIEASIHAAIEALADNPPEELGDGSNVIHVLTPPPPPQQQQTDDDNTVVCPRPGSDLRVLLRQEDGTTVGALQVSVEKTAPGSESEYLPDVYKPLFQDEALRRPAFVESRKRLEQSRASKEQREANQQVD